MQQNQNVFCQTRKNNVIFLPSNIGWNKLNILIWFQVGKKRIITDYSLIVIKKPLFFVIFFEWQIIRVGIKSVLLCTLTNWHLGLTEEDNFCWSMTLNACDNQTDKKQAQHSSTQRGYFIELHILYDASLTF